MDTSALIPISSLFQIAFTWSDAMVRSTNITWKRLKFMPVCKTLFMVQWNNRPLKVTTEVYTGTVNSLW